MPGTWGSLWGVLIFYLLRNEPRPVFFGITLFIFGLAIFSSHRAEKIFGEKDCQKIVIDEVAGQLVTYLFVSYHWKDLVAGFIVFRLFDMVKIFPARLAQDKLPGGFGIVMDDVIAGVQAGALLWISHRSL